MGPLGQIKPSYVGYGLLEAWSLCMLFDRGGENLAYFAQQGASSAMYGFLANVSAVAVIAGTLVLVLLCRSSDVLRNRTLLTVVAAACNVAGTALVLFGSAPAATVGFMVAGLANAWLWVSWGDVFSVFETATAERVAMCSAVVQAVAVVILQLIPAAFRMGALLLLAPIAAVMYVRAMGHVAQLPALADGGERFCRPIVFNGRFALRMVAGLGVPVFMTYYLIDSDVVLPVFAGGFDGMLAGGLLLFTVALYAFVRYARGFSISSICRLMSSLLVVVVLAVGLGAALSLAQIAAVALVLLAQYLFMMYAARLCRQGFGNPVFTFGVVWLLNHASGFVGVSASLAVRAAAGAGVFQAESVALVALALLFALVLCVRDDDAVDARDVACAAQRDAGRRDAFEDAEMRRGAALFAVIADHGLTAREAEIAALLLKGRSAPFIRDELVISLNTVSSHIKHIYAKLNVHTRQELIDLVEGYEGTASRV